MKNRNTLRLKLYLMIIVSVVILSIVAVMVSSYFYSLTLSARYKGTIQSVCETTAGLVKNENYEAYLKNDNRSEYIKLQEKVATLKNAVPDVECIGVYKMETDGMRTIIDTNSQELVGGLGKLSSYDNTWRNYKDNLMQGKLIEDARVMANTGRVTMYCMPVAGDSEGSYVYICVGVAESLIARDKNEFTKENRGVISALAFLIIALSLVFVEFRVVKPIRKISAFVNQAVERSDVGFIQEIRSRKVNTKNELENLYHSLIKIYTSKARLESVYEKSDPKEADTAISLIKRMDKFAESHLDNSLQYIILLVSKMREHEKFKDILTDKKCEDILLAAPLHDIGKLAVPDGIVNKPDRLTDEEYEYMKKHSKMGAKIIDEMYLKFSNESYLNMAREIALSHHERWDGTGYPNNLKGEDIPVEVRIVSIADVFDALVSERVYKPPYSFDEAMGIITSYRGTFFDPEITDVFIEARNEVYEVYKSVSKNKVQA